MSLKNPGLKLNHRYRQILMGKLKKQKNHSLLIPNTSTKMEAK